MISAWRITKTRYAHSVFDGEGARLNGGRWNSAGTRVAYASESVALATLEVLVGLQQTGLLSSYSVIQAEFPADIVEALDRRALPADWNHHPPLPDTQRLGDLWVAEARSAVLRVPSAVIIQESNYLLNPRHPDFAKVVVHPPEPFQLDPRLPAQHRQARPGR